MFLEENFIQMLIRIIRGQPPQGGGAVDIFVALMAGAAGFVMVARMLERSCW